MQKLFQVPVAPIASGHYSRQLFKLAVVGIILGAVFLMFWQGVLQFGAGPATWDEQYCRQLLSRYDSAILTDTLAQEGIGDNFRLTDVLADGAETVEMVGVDGKIATCSITLISDQSTGDGFDHMYNCTLSTVRYKNDIQNDWLMTSIQTELAADLFPSNVGRFVTTITYYNPAAQASFTATEETLEARSCEI